MISRARTGLFWSIATSSLVQALQGAISRDSGPQFVADLDDNFQITLQVGTPAQTFQVLPDSGAGSVALSSVFLPANETEGKTLYDPSKSSTATQLVGYSYKNCYGSGHCGEGDVYNDTMTVGGINVDLAFEVSTSNNGVGDGNNGGDFGMAYSEAGMSTSPNKVPTWFQSIMGQLDQKVFGIEWTGSGGQLQLGWVNTSYEISYAPLNADYYWGVNFTGYEINGNFTEETWTVVVDSGTAKSGLPTDVTEAYFATVKGSNTTETGWTYPCGSLPDFVFAIGDYRGTIPGSVLEGRSLGNGQCLSDITPSSNTVIFGQNFMTAQYVLFDYAGKRVGFANKNVVSNGTSAVNGTANGTTTSSQSKPTSGGSRGFETGGLSITISLLAIFWMV